MATELYQATCLRVEGDTATVYLSMLYSEAGFHADRSFALMLLVEAARAGDPLAERVSLDEVLDPSWMERHATGFIRDIALEIEDARHASLVITATHPAWVAHVTDRQWSSTAFPSARWYKPCAPIVPGAPDAAGPSDEHTGMMPVPTALWELDDPPPAKLPAVVMVPRYGKASYRVVNELTGVQSRSSLAALAWRPVRLTASGFSNDGVLVLQGSRFQLWMFSAGAGGRLIERYDAIERIGALAWKPGAIPGAKISYATVLERIIPRVIGVRRNGAVTELDLALGPDGRLPVLRDASDIARLSGSRIQAQHVVSFELRAPAAPALPLPDLDALDAAAVRSVFEALPPVATLVVKTKKQGEREPSA